MTKKAYFLHTLEKAVAARGVALMGVCNVTPDSFSDGGRYFREEDARARIDGLLGEGADIVDIGGESTRPGAAPVPVAEQLQRVLPAIRYAAPRVCVSIDTASSEVAEAALAAGAHVVNDVSCLRDEAIARVAAAADAALLLMHSRGPQEKMRGFSQYPEAGYGDVVADVLAEWHAAAARARAEGLPDDALIFDPGLGFMKSARHSAELLRRLPELVAAAGVPVAIGASNKSFLTLVEPTAAPDQRLGASIGAAIAAVRAGATIVRVHDVRATRQAIDVLALCVTPPVATAEVLRA